MLTGVAEGEHTTGAEAMHGPSSPFSALLGAPLPERRDGASSECTSAWGAPPRTRGSPPERGTRARDQHGDQLHACCCEAAGCAPTLLLL